MGNTKKYVSVGDLEKVDVISKLLQVCQNNDKDCQERLNRLEITCDILKKNDFVLKEYSICYPDEEDNNEVEPMDENQELTAPVPIEDGKEKKKQ